MEDTETPPRERRTPQNWRSQASSNWRLKDDSPRTETPSSRSQPRTFDSSPRENGRSIDQNRESRRPFEQRNSNTSSPSAPLPDAPAGTRLYVGNLLYSAQIADIESFFTEAGFVIANISMSTDPFTGRNPSYCFVDLETPEEASRAMSELSGKEVLGRPVKINPGVTKKSFGPGTSTSSRGWNGPREGVRDGGTGNNRTTSSEYKPNFDRWSRTDASDHWKGAADGGKRLYVGGLPQINGQSTVDAEMQALFEGFSIATVSKIISPHPSKASEPGNHFYLFIDLASSEETEQAIEKLDGSEAPWGGKLRVSKARGDSRRVNREQGAGETTNANGNGSMGNRAREKVSDMASKMGDLRIRRQETDGADS